MAKYPLTFAILPFISCNLTCFSRLNLMSFNLFNFACSKAKSSICFCGKFDKIFAFVYRVQCLFLAILLVVTQFKHKFKNIFALNLAVKFTLSNFNNTLGKNNNQIQRQKNS